MTGSIEVDIMVLSEGENLVPKDLHLWIFEVAGEGYGGRSTKLGKAAIDIAYYCSMHQQVVDGAVLVKFKPVGELELYIHTEWRPNFGEHLTSHHSDLLVTETSDISFLSTSLGGPASPHTDVHSSQPNMARAAYHGSGYGGVGDTCGSIVKLERV